MSDDEAQKQAREAEVAERMAEAEVLLRNTFGAAVTLSQPEVLREQYRNHVLRCNLESAVPELPESVIIKSSVGEGDQAYDPNKDTVGTTAWRFFNEWGGTLFLNRQHDTPPHCARLIAGDRAKGLFILEDLGSGPSLADVVTGDSPTRAEEALINYAKALGRIHADTVYKKEEWERTRLEIGGAEPGRERKGTEWVRESVTPFREICQSLDVPLSADFDDDIAVIEQRRNEPGAFDTFSPEDTCPDNNRLMPDGTLRFFDFEFAGYRHALMDAAYIYLPFPTCWCVNRLPDGLADRMAAVYRTELVRGCTVASEDTLFTSHLCSMCASWTISTLSWQLKSDIEEDHEWGICSTRQRHILRLDNFVSLAGRWGYHPGISATCVALATKLRSLWPPEADQMPVYPAFRTPVAISLEDK